LFDPVEEPLDPVASAVEMRAEADRIGAIAAPADHLNGIATDFVGLYPLARTAPGLVALTPSRTR